MSVIILTFFFCGWIGGVCWILGVIQKQFQKSKSKYQRLKVDLRKSMLNKE